MCHVSCVMCHVSCIMYHVSCIMYHVSCIMYHVSSYHVSCHHVIRNCHQKLSSEIVIRNCHQKLSSEIVILVILVFIEITVTKVITASILKVVVKDRCVFSGLIVIGQYHV